MALRLWRHHFLSPIGFISVESKPGGLYILMHISIYATLRVVKTGYGNYEDRMFHHGAYISGKKSRGNAGSPGYPMASFVSFCVTLPSLRFAGRTADIHCSCSAHSSAAPLGDRRLRGAWLFRLSGVSVHEEQYTEENGAGSLATLSPVKDNVRPACRQTVDAKFRGLSSSLLLCFLPA